MCLRLLQALKALCSITFTVFGISKFSIFTQSLKAQYPILSNPGFKITLVIV